MAAIEGVSQNGCAELQGGGEGRMGGGREKRGGTEGPHRAASRILSARWPPTTTAGPLSNGSVQGNVIAPGHENSQTTVLRLMRKAYGVL